jgi:glycosyltransferase involved in cell wall biosynthesis
MTVKAIYENGVFKPQQPIDLDERTEVAVLIPARSSRDASDPTGWKAAEATKPESARMSLLGTPRGTPRTISRVRASRSTDDLEVSVVMPCLNEADTLATCIRKARGALDEAGIRAEIIVADNGSSDASVEIAEREGARVVSVTARGYGAALMGGIDTAKGRFIIMGDADDSYDFGEIPKFVERLREGFDLVQGCRLESGGGRVLPGAMPFLHRWLGNPMFSVLARRWFRAPVRDIYCGMRGFTRDLVSRLDQRCTGMEFATEMVVKASLGRARMAQVPITLHPDGRRAHPPHLKTFRDGWRTLRFFLLYSPRQLFLVPGLVLIALGLLGYALAMPGVTVGGLTFDAHTLLFASLAVISGYQSASFAVFAKTFAITEGLLPADPRVDRFRRLVTLERGLLMGVLGATFGSILLLAAMNEWRIRDFGPLNYAETMRLVVPGVTLFVLGFQTVLGCFFLSLLDLRQR